MVYEVINSLLTQVKGSNPIWDAIYRTFIRDNRYEVFLKGIANTLLVAAGACVLGLILGVLIAYLRILPQDTWYKKLASKICKGYVTIIRGTPIALQLLIMYFGVLTFMKHIGGGAVVAVIAFGMNSAAYMSEILRGGILAVDKGQYEAGRSLGFNWQQTTSKIILPQAVKSTTPSIFNELIALVKETSVLGFIGVVDITRAGQTIMTQTATVMLPLVTTALIYLVIVLFLEWIQRKIERRLAKSDRS